MGGADVSDDATARIDALRARNRHAFDLAVLASIAVHVEPELLRTLRLRFLPHADAGAEADLWFSELVSSKGRFALILDPSVRVELWRLLAVDPQRLDAVADCVARAHAGAEEILRVQEAITVLGLRENASRDPIEQALRPLVATLFRDRHDGIARWTRRVYPYLPSAVKNTPAARLLVTRSITGGARDAHPSGEGSASSALELEIRTLPRRRIALHMDTDALELTAGDSSEPEVRTIEVPATDPMLVEVSWALRRRQTERMLLHEGEVRRIPREGDTVILTNILGEAWTVEVNPAADDWAMILDTTGQNLGAELADWFASRDGARVPREHIVFEPPLAPRGPSRRAYVYLAGTIWQREEELDVFERPFLKAHHIDFRTSIPDDGTSSLELRELINDLLRSFQEVVVIGDCSSDEKLRSEGTPSGLGQCGMIARAAEKPGKFTRDLLTGLLERSADPSVAVRFEDLSKLISGHDVLTWGKTGDLLLVEPRRTLFELKVVIPPPLRQNRVRVVDVSGRVLSEIVGKRSESLYLPPGIYFAEIADPPLVRSIVLNRNRQVLQAAWKFSGKWVIVAGTGEYHLLDEERFMAEAIGRKLAGAGYGLIVGGKPGVDYLAADNLTKSLALFGQKSEDYLLQFCQGDCDYRGGKKTIVSDREESYHRPLDHAAAIILVGGHDGTERYFRRARERRVPVIPIAGTKNAAARVYQTLVDSGNVLPEWLRHEVKDVTSATAMAERTIRLLATTLLRATPTAPRASRG